MGTKTVRNTMNEIPDRHIPALIARFNEQVDRGGPEESCWLWRLGLNPQGYGKVKILGETVRAHRYSWMMHKGPIPEDMLVLHKCDVNSCVNPDHLFLGTASDNAQDRDNKRRGRNSSKTHCIHGHEFTPENTYERNGVRWCRVCDRERKKDPLFRHKDVA